MFSTRRTPTALRTPSGICVHSVEWLPCGRLGVSLADLLLFRWPAAFSAPNLGRLDRIADRRLTHPQRFLQAGQTKPRGRGYWKAATRQHLPGYTGPESPSTRTLWTLHRTYKPLDLAAQHVLVGPVLFILFGLDRRLRTCLRSNCVFSPSWTRVSGRRPDTDVPRWSHPPQFR